jgi:hypothetical protein
MVPCYLGCDDPEERQRQIREARRRRRPPRARDYNRAARVPTAKDAERRARLEPLLLRVAEKHGLNPDELRGGRRATRRTFPARVELAVLAELELEMTESAVSKALGMNASTLPAFLSRRAS